MSVPDHLFTLDSVLWLKVKGIGGTPLALSLWQHNSCYFILTNNEPRHEKTLFSGLSTRYDTSSPISKTKMCFFMFI